MSSLDLPSIRGRTIELLNSVTTMKDISRSLPMAEMSPSRIHLLVEALQDNLHNSDR